MAPCAAGSGGLGKEPEGSFYAGYRSGRAGQITLILRMAARSPKVQLVPLVGSG